MSKVLLELYKNIFIFLRYINPENTASNGTREKPDSLDSYPELACCSPVWMDLRIGPEEQSGRFGYCAPKFKRNIYINIYIHTYIFINYIFI